MWLYIVIFTLGMSIGEVFSLLLDESHRSAVDLKMLVMGFLLGAYIDHSITWLVANLEIGVPQ